MPAYLARMRIPVLSSFASAWRDLRQFAGTRQRHEYIVALVSILITATIVGLFYVDSTNIPYPERITYVQNWPANRTDAQIRAEQKHDALLKKQAQAQKQAAYKRLADELGIDTNSR